MSIPIFIHYEGTQSYLRDCIEQAGKYNKRIVLFGNKSNAGMCRECQDVSMFSSPLWEEFREHYRHMSSNSREYELLCFKRYFIYYDFMEKNRIEECICLDSDILVYADLSKAIVAKKCTAAFHVPEAEGAAWVGCAYWRKTLLLEFLLYCIDIYKNHNDSLNDEWKALRRRHLPGAISDMTLAGRWLRSRGGVNNIWIWTKYSKEGVVDQNFSVSGNWLCNEYCLDRFGVGKRIIVKKGRPYFISIEHGLVRALMIHFQGDKKIYMHYFRKHMKIAFCLPYISKVAAFIKNTIKAYSAL